MDPSADLEGSQNDWLKSARHVLAASAIVTRARALVLIKFDGERCNGKRYTVDIDGNGNGILDFRQETSDFAGAVSKAFPLETESDESEIAMLAAVLQKWDAWARDGFVLGLQIFWNGEVTFYSVFILGEHGVFERIGVRGSALLDVMLESARQFEARLDG
ncbi:hypothetical protein [Luteibacter aegosomatissinici]|uniref:hypothetical protein n=1 Tax=Luteibacter aegosomatissinici TaxID=2911539 RepID=UPI001FF7C82E|nr:hypothetical protein [Luteibacter aegosomatissinici]UPG92645.1 hypothetical protein L2Y97_12280 [Luteibacter aegosomatissinici]